MSKRRLIPKLQLKTSHYNPSKMVLVTTKQFSDFIEIGDAVSQSKIFQDQGADELIFINIDRVNKGIDILAGIIHNVSAEIFMPITVGGGVQTEQDFRTLLSNGADKISINTIAVNNPDIINNASAKYGAQCVVVSIDYKQEADEKCYVYINNGSTKTKLSPIDWAVECEQRGAGELLLCNIDRDGMRYGLDNEICNAIATQVKIPVITSGGCGLAKHFIDGFKQGQADAVASGTFFAMQDQNFMQTRSQIKNSGINIRVYS